MRNFFAKSEGPLMIERDYQSSQWTGEGRERRIKRLREKVAQCMKGRKMTK